MKILILTERTVVSYNDENVRFTEVNHMEKIWKELYENAKLVLNARRISDYVTAGEVSAAILSK